MVTINSLHISGAAVKGFLGGSIGGFTSGAAGAALTGAGWEQAFGAGFKGAAIVAAVGGVIGAGRGFRQARIEGRNPWNGELKLNKAIGAAQKGFSKLPKDFKEVREFGRPHGQKFSSIRVIFIQKILMLIMEGCGKFLKKQANV